MSSNFLGLLIVLFSSLVSVNVIMAMRNDAVMLAWLNQLFLGTILVAVVSYVVVAFGTRKPRRNKVEERK